MTRAQVQAMRADPAVVEDLLHDTVFVQEQKPGLFARLFGKTPPPRARALSWIGAEQQYDLDHQWHILHFLLTGSSDGGPFPACFICNEGEEVGSDLGYGPPRLFTSAQARLIADHLAAIGEQDLLGRYQADEIDAHQIYWRPPASGDEQREDARGLWATIGEMARFIDDTARQDCALVVEIY